MSVLNVGSRLWRRTMNKAKQTLDVVAGTATAGESLVADANLDLAGLRNLSITGSFRSIAVPAAAGANQGNATALTADMNAVTGADGTKGVKLPTAVSGHEITIINTGTSPLKVYPATGGAINALSADAAFSLNPKTSASFDASSATQWYTSAIAGTRASAITAPSGGATIDAESRTAINAIIAALQAIGVVA